MSEDDGFIVAVQSRTRHRCSVLVVSANNAKRYYFGLNQNSYFVCV